MTPKSAGDMWLEEYNHALEALRIALARVHVAVDSVRVENNKLKSELVTYKQLWKSTEAVIKEYGIEKEKEYTGKEVKDKYFPNIDTDTVSSSDCVHHYDVFYSQNEIVCRFCKKAIKIDEEKDDPD